MQSILVSLNPSAQVFAGQAVTLDFDSTKITAEGAPQITDSNGNPLQPNTIIIDNNSSVDDPNPSYQEVQSDLNEAENNLSAAQAEITSKQAALDNLQSQYDDALNQVTLTEAERDAYQSDLQQAQNDLDQANNNLSAAQAEITSKQAAIDSLQADYDDARAQIAFTEAERDAYQSDLQQAQADLDQANNNLASAQAELTNLQGQLDAIPAKATSGWSESSGQSITIEFDQSISSDNGNDLFSLIYNNSLSVYIEGEQLTSTDISNIYFGNPSYDASGGMTDASMYDPSMDGSGMTDGSGYDPYGAAPAGGTADPYFSQAQLEYGNGSTAIRLTVSEQFDETSFWNNKEAISSYFSVNINGQDIPINDVYPMGDVVSLFLSNADYVNPVADNIHVSYNPPGGDQPGGVFENSNGADFAAFDLTLDQTGMAFNDASSGMADGSGYDASGGMASGPSCFTIEFNDGSYLKEGQTVFVSYDGGGGLVDSNENSINSFSQIVNNSSTVYNDETAPTLMASPMPSLLSLIHISEPRD